MNSCRSVVAGHERRTKFSVGLANLDFDALLRSCLQRGVNSWNVLIYSEMGSKHAYRERGAVFHELWQVFMLLDGSKACYITRSTCYCYLSLEIYQGERTRQIIRYPVHYPISHRFNPVYFLHARQNPFKTVLHDVRQ